MTNAATGHAINGHNKGWRFALTENPALEGVLPNRNAECELSLMSGKI